MMVIHLDLLAPYQGAARDSGLKEGEVVAVEEKTPQRKKAEQLGGRSDITSRSLGRRKLGTPVGYSGQTTLRREECDM
jgi:hypothetical protein